MFFRRDFIFFRESCKRSVASFSRASRHFKVFIFNRLKVDTKIKLCQLLTNMTVAIKFPKQLRKRLFSVKQAEELGLSKRTLQSLYESGQIERVARGIYQSVNAEFSNEDQLNAATLRMGYPSAICLVSALVQYNLTDTIPRKVWIMVPVSKRTAHKDLKLLRCRSPLWEIGIVKENGYRITSLERTLVDCLIYRRLVGLQTFIDALKRSIQQKKTTPGKILDMAVQLKVDHRLRPYLEVLA